MNFMNSQIVIAKDAHFDVKSAAMRLQQYFHKEAGWEVPIVSDDAQEKPGEILLGRVARPESAKVRPDTWKISVKNGKLVFDAVHYSTVDLAQRAFTDTGKVRVDADFTLKGETKVPLKWGTYDLVWNDEFDGDALDFDKWTGNANMAMPDVVLSVEPGVVDVKHGDLVLTSRILDRSNPQRRYVSNYAITTCDTMNYRYGYMEIRAKVPHYGMGEWPSFWYISANSELFLADYREKHGEDYKREYFTEIDAFEVFNDKYHVISNLHKWYYEQGKDEAGNPIYRYHNGKGEPIKHEALDGIVPNGKGILGSRGYYFTDEEEPNAYHTYGFLWTPDEMSFSVDGKFYYTYDMHKDFGAAQSGIAGIDEQPLYVIFNNMLYPESWGNGGYIKPGEEGNALFPLLYEIDYCRLYQLEGEGELYLPKEPGHGKKIAGKDRFHPEG